MKLIQRMFIRTPKLFELSFWKFVNIDYKYACD